MNEMLIEEVCKSTGVNPYYLLFESVNCKECNSKSFFSRKVKCYKCDSPWAKFIYTVEDVNDSKASIVEIERVNDKWVAIHKVIFMEDSCFRRKR